MITEVTVANILSIFTINEIITIAGPILFYEEDFSSSLGGWRWQWEHWLWGVSHNDVGQGISHLLILIRQMLFCATNVILCDKYCFVGSYVVLWEDMLFTIYGLTKVELFRWKKMRSMRTFGKRSESLIGMETGIFMFEIW